MKRTPATLFVAGLLVLPVLLGACTREAPEPSAPAATYDTFGAAIEPQDAVPVQAVVAEPEPYLGQTVKIEGVAREVCQMAGCWLTLDAGDGRYVRVNVARKDDGGYAFTVPKDISGRRVVVVGTLALETLSPETAAHLAEDGRPAGDTTATPPSDTAAGPVDEFQLTASGVLVEKVRA